MLFDRVAELTIVLQAQRRVGWRDEINARGDIRGHTVDAACHRERRGT